MPVSPLSMVHVFNIETVFAVGMRGFLGVI